MWRVVLLCWLMACSGGSDDSDTEVGSDADTSSDTESGTDAGTDADTDSEAVDTTACDTCEQQTSNAQGSCYSACINQPNFCAQELCRDDCDQQAAENRVNCLGPRDECASQLDRAECMLGCFDAYETCASGAVCPPQGCQDTLYGSCLGVCG